MPAISMSGPDNCRSGVIRGVPFGCARTSRPQTGEREPLAHPMFVCFGDAQEAPVSADDPNPSQPTIDPTAEGARARAENKPREACPYAPDTEERHEWLEGYDGMSTEGSALVPEAKRGC